MIIGIDGNEANVEKKVGVSVYCYNLLKIFRQQANKNTQFIVFLKHPPRDDLPLENTYFKYQIVPGKIFWSQVFLPLSLFGNNLIKKKLNLFFSPAHYAPRFSPIPSVVTIHDLSYLYFPKDFLKKDLFKLKNWTQYSIKKAKKIIAVSKSTKKDILKNYPIDEKKITVIYNGYEKPKLKAQKLKGKTKDDLYFLFVGTIQPRKNISTLIKAFEKFTVKHPRFNLILAGKKGWLYQEILNQIKNLGLSNKIYFTDYITDHQLVFLYQNAFALIMPSLYEGFGIPLLEAMSFSCPVISSFASSLPEIGGEACLYFDPKDANSLLEKMKELTNNNQLRKQLIEKGKERVKLFSWEKCGQQTLQTLISAAKEI